MSGATYRAIAPKVEVKTESAVYKLINRALRFTLQEPAEEVRQLELARLDRMMLSIWTAAKRGELEAMDRVLRIMDRRARYLGLDAPMKVAPTDPTGKDPYESLSDEERAGRIMAILDAARARKAAAAADNHAAEEPPAPGLPAPPEPGTSSA